jgi:filamentous hemagglutinin family protein
MAKDWQMILTGSLAIGVALISPTTEVLAQNITLDGSLGTSGTLTGPNYVIPQSVGQAVGNNLFHSFDKFNLNANEAAIFSSADNIRNILSRVTGGTPSNIDGLIRTLGSNVNFFLINPRGIIFGQNARLDVGGSFVASTASSLKFADGSQFSATAHPTTPLLTVSVPVGLQFGSHVEGIHVQGQGAVRGEAVNAPLLNREAGLSVRQSKTLALVGSGVALEGGILTTDGGRIELGSVAGPGLVSLTPIDSGWALGYESIVTFRDIQLSGAAAVDASGSGGGDIQVRGRRLTVTDGSQIEASTLGSQSGGTLNITTSESVEVIGESANPEFNSGLYAQVYPGATGAGGNLTVETGRLIVQGWGQITTSTLGAGSAGKVTLKTGRLILRDGGQVLSATFDEGTAGTLAVTASESVELIGSGTGFGQILRSALITGSRGTGNAGNMTIETGQLIVRDRARILASNEESGKAGNIEISASSIRLDNQASIRSTTSAGQQGNIILRSEDLVLSRGSSITTNATGTSTGGNINIDIGVIAALENSDITANAEDARGGQVIINAQGIFGAEFRERENPATSDITATSKLGAEFSGSVEINTPDTDPSRGLIELPTNLVDASQQIAQGCTPRGRQNASRFIATGRGGLPLNPYEPLRGRAVITGWVDLSPQVTERVTDKLFPASVTKSTNQIVEAQGWIVDPNGDVILVAKSGQNSSIPSGIPCNQ